MRKILCQACGRTHAPEDWCPASSVATELPTSVLIPTINRESFLEISTEESLEKNSLRATPPPLPSYTPRNAEPLETRQIRVTPVPQPSDVRLDRGTILGEYVLEKRIASGGMGELWKGKHRQFGSTHAFKFLYRHLSEDHVQVERFLREAEAISRVRHPNIVEIDLCGKLADNRPFLVMEYLEGQTLGDYLDKNAPLPSAEIFALAEQLCSALGAVHAAEVIHRDLTPENIFLTTTGIVKIIDFGLSHLGVLAPDAKRLTRTGVLLGTPGYFPPEQALAHPETDERSDLYTLAVVLFEAFCGRHPFYVPADNLLQRITKSMETPLPALEDCVEGRKIPMGLNRFFHRALAKDRAARYPNVATFWDEFSKVMKPFAAESREDIAAAKAKISVEGRGKRAAAKTLMAEESAIAPSATAPDFWIEPEPTPLPTPPSGEAAAETQPSAARRLWLPAALAASLVGLLGFALLSSKKTMPTQSTLTTQLPISTSLAVAPVASAPPASLPMQLPPPPETQPLPTVTTQPTRVVSTSIPVVEPTQPTTPIAVPNNISTTKTLSTTSSKPKNNTNSTQTVKTTSVKKTTTSSPPIFDDLFGSTPRKK